MNRWVERVGQERGGQRNWARRERRDAGLWAVGFLQERRAFRSGVQELEALYLHTLHPATQKPGAGADQLPARPESRLG